MELSPFWEPEMASGYTLKKLKKENGEKQKILRFD
jgi:hypothetical protein